MSKENIIDELKSKREILLLQQNYETGKISEKDMTENEKSELLTLYNEQIETLEQNISMYKNMLQDYKNKIIAIKRNITQK